MCGSFWTHLASADDPEYDLDDLAEQIELLKTGKKRSTRTLQKMTEDILDHSPALRKSAMAMLRESGYLEKVIAIAK